MVGWGVGQGSLSPAVEGLGAPKGQMGQQLINLEGATNHPFQCNGGGFFFICAILLLPFLSKFCLCQFIRGGLWCTVRPLAAACRCTRKGVRMHKMTM